MNLSAMVDSIHMRAGSVHLDGRFFARRLSAGFGGFFQLRGPNTLAFGAGLAGQHPVTRGESRDDLRHGGAT